MRIGLFLALILVGCGEGDTDVDPDDTGGEHTDHTDDTDVEDTDDTDDTDVEDTLTEEPTEATDTRIVQVVGTDGVVMELAGATLTIPEGALSGKTALTFEEAGSDHRRGYKPLSPIFRLSPDVTFDAPVTLTIHLDGAHDDATIFARPLPAPEPRITDATVDGSDVSVALDVVGEVFAGRAPYDPYPELPAIPEGYVPAVMALGDLGRTTYTCDDGRTWIHERSLDAEGDEDVCGIVQDVVCFTSGESCTWADAEDTCNTMDTCDCDHHVASPKGLDYWDGTWWMTLGWGKPGSVRRSTDGVTWTVVHENQTFGSILGTFHGVLAPTRYNPVRTSNGGASWDTVPNPPMFLDDGGTDYHVRNAGFAPYGSGRAILQGNEDIVLSPDGGDTWLDVDPAVGDCQGGKRVAYGNGTIVLGSSRNGRVCASADGGETWVVQTLRDDAGDVNVAWDGSRFLVFGGGQRYESVDGETWTASAAELPRFLGQVTAFPETGTLVGIHEGWQQWYEKQRFYRSTDGGLTWETLDEGSALRGHRIRHTTYGWVPAAGCE